MTTGTTSSKPETDRGAARKARRRPSHQHAHRHRHRAADPPAGDRRVPDQGQEDRRRTSATDYVVEASVGHIRDLPARRRRRPGQVQGRVVGAARRGRRQRSSSRSTSSRPEKKGKVAELRDALKDVDELLLATDPDREGEAIAWHLLETLKPKVPVRRMVFHEITEPAIRAAVANLRDLDQDLVDAQETRRILDRLYGYEVSPVLWKKVMPKLSAGRVQSVATRIIVQRERERMAFVVRRLLGHRRAARRRAPRPTPAAVRRPAGRGRRRPGRHRPRLRPGRAAQAARPRAPSTRPSARRLAEALQGRDLTVAVGRVEAVHAQALRRRS